ncbi:MAG: hypothetical protein WC792_04905 [Candidatus Micrarchaeia archaeon]|jgi:hypothetical protein
MGIKDTVVGLYIKNYLIPRNQILDKPGFIAFNLSGKSSIFVRQVIIPESFFVNLEKKLIEQLGDEGKQILYSTGKRFGYRFALLGNFVTKNSVSSDELQDNLAIITKFIEGTYASEISAQTNLAIPKVEFTISRFVVIEKLGYGYFLPLGAAAGLMSRLFDDPHIECGQLPSLDNKQRILCAPNIFLTGEKIQHFEETDLSKLEIERDYRALNEISQITNSTRSFQQMIDSKLFSYHEGIITRGEERYFIYEVSGLYLLELTLSNNKKTSSTFYDCAFQTGANSIVTEKTSADIINLLSAFGWGDPVILTKDGKYRVIVTHYPWTQFFSEISFQMFCGIVSGMLSKIANRPVNVKLTSKTTNQGSLAIVLDEA